MSTAAGKWKWLTIAAPAAGAVFLCICCNVSQDLGALPDADRPAHDADTDNAVAADADVDDDSPQDGDRADTMVRDSDTFDGDNDGPPCDRDRDSYLSSSADCAGLDCDDSNRLINPGQTERCANRWDDDCDGLTDPLAVLHGEATEITFTTSDSEQPTLAFSGEEHGLAWHDWRLDSPHIFFARVNRHGQKIEDEIHISVETTGDFASALSPSMVWTGSSYALVWADVRASVSAIYLALLSAEGQRLAPDLELVGPSPAHPHNRPELIWTGSSLALVWTGPCDIEYSLCFQRFSPSGEPLGPPTAVSEPEPTGWFSVHWTGAELAIVYVDTDAHDTSQFFLTRISDLGEVVEAGLQITDTAASKSTPSLAWNGQGYGLAWMEYIEGSLTDYELLFAELSDTGQATTPRTPIGEFPGEPGRVRLLWNGHEYGLVWDRRFQIFFARLARGGEQSAPTVTVVHNQFCTYELSAIATGDQYAVAWRHCNVPSGSNIRFARVAICL